MLTCDFTGQTALATGASTGIRLPPAEGADEPAEAFDAVTAANWTCTPGPR